MGWQQPRGTTCFMPRARLCPVRWVEPGSVQDAGWKLVLLLEVPQQL